MQGVFKRISLRTSLRNQVLVLAIIPLGLVALLCTYLSVAAIISHGEERIKSYQETLMVAKKEALKNYSAMAIQAVINLPPEQAKEQLKYMRYEGGTGYFWVNDFKGLMLSHPDPGLDGKDQIGLKDPNGVYIIKEAIKACQEKDEGYINYVWKNPMSGKIGDKLSYVVTMKKWNWVLGNGVYIDDIHQMVAQEREKIRGQVSALIKQTILITLAVVLTIILLVGYFVKKMISLPVAGIIKGIKEFNNDLTLRVPVMTRNEIGELAQWFNNHTANLHGIIAEVTEGTQKVNASATAISAAVSEQATVSNQQSSSVSEITSTMEELSASSRQIADHSNAVVGIAAKTLEDTRKGALEIQAYTAKMDEIKNDNEASIGEIIDLGKKSKEISKVMEIINHVADQTKLIAFNASLEAASAGEAGKRFGVVAAEIRRLADSVMESTGEIEGKVNEIQDAIQRLVISSEKGSKTIREGMDYSVKTADLLGNIVTGSESTTNAARQISVSTQQEKTASDQIVVALREIDQGARQTSDSIRQISSISNELKDLSSNLMKLVAQFRLQKMPPESGIGALFEKQL